MTKKVFYHGRRRTQHKLGMLVPGENTFSIEVANKLIALKLVAEVKSIKKSYEDKQVKEYKDKPILNKQFNRKMK